MLSPCATLILAILVLIGWVLFWVIYGLIAVRRSNYTAVQSIVYFYGYLVARILWRTKIHGRLSVSVRQGAIIICNHRCPFDPAFVQLVARRVVHWMVAREYCRHPTLAWFFRIIESIPVSRAGVDTSSTRTAIRYAQAGKLVGLFPEGRLNQSDELLLPGRPGAALIAIRAKVPVIPCFVLGTPQAKTIFGTLLKPAYVQLWIGPPIDVSPYYGMDHDRATLEALSKIFLCEIAKLAGQEEFEPQLAGRHWRLDKS